MTIIRTLGTFLLGAATGITLGILYAPDKGSNTRKNIIGKKDDLIYEAEFKVEEGKEFVKNKYQQGKEKVRDLTAKVRTASDETEKDFSEGKFRSKQPSYTSSAQ